MIIIALYQNKEAVARFAEAFQQHGGLMLIMTTKPSASVGFSVIGAIVVLVLSAIPRQGCLTPLPI